MPLLAACRAKNRHHRRRLLPRARRLGSRRSASGPDGDTKVAIDITQHHLRRTEEDLHGYIDEHIDEHVLNLQKWIQQPSISNTGEGIQESAEMVKGFFDQLGCQEIEGL